MRKSVSMNKKDFKLLIVDDDQIIIDTIIGYLQNSVYELDSEVDPFKAIEKIKNNNYDILILDFMMEGLHGDEVVERIRVFNSELYILLLTGFKDMVPPIETIRRLDIQGYCEKTDNLEQLELLIESAVKSIKQKRTIIKYNDGLSNILDTVPNIYKLMPIEKIMTNILKGLIPFVNIKNSFILIDNITLKEDNKSQLLYRELGDCKIMPNKQFFEMDPVALEYLGKARAEERTIITDKKIVLPLKDEHSNIVGILYVEGKTDNNSLKLLEIYSAQSAAALSNATLHMIINSKNKELGRTYNELKTRYVDTVEALRLTVDAKDSDTRGHSDRVSQNAVLFGKRLGLSEEDLETLKVGGIFHDIGKIGIGDDVLLKNGKLNAEEFNEIKMHPKRGAHILSAILVFQNVVPLVMYHHERYDGTGYPYGLKAEKIPYLARVIAIVDAYDAMISNRRYRGKLDLEETKDQLRKGAGTQFDEKIVKEFLDMINDPIEFAKMVTNDTDESKIESNELCEF
ncbi:MAG: HD domain-containing response regulator [Clostridiales bacterium]